MGAVTATRDRPPAHLREPGERAGEHGLGFAGALSASLLGGQVLALAGVGPRHTLAAVFERVLIWWIPVCVFLIVGGFAEGDARIALWVVALAVLYVVTGTGFPVPRLGRSLTSDYTITGAHMAERSYLFITIALGESILVIGSQFGELPRTPSTVAAFVTAFIGSVAIWWISFDRSAEAAREAIAAAPDPGRLGIVAYTYFHVPIVAGIIVAAAGYELAMAHPGDQLCLLLRPLRNLGRSGVEPAGSHAKTGRSQTSRSGDMRSSARTPTA